jgi:hypothetical protein
LYIFEIKEINLNDENAMIKDWTVTNSCKPIKVKISCPFPLTLAMHLVDVKRKKGLDESGHPEPSPTVLPTPRPQ